MRTMRIALLAAWTLGSLAAQKSSASQLFSRYRPIIQRSCQGCHQPAMKYGGLDLTRYESFSAGGNKGPGFKVGAPQESLVLAYLKGERQPRMPFGTPPLGDDQIEMFLDLIASGAKDDTPPEARESLPLDKPPVYHLAPVITALAYSPDGSLLAVSGYREVLLHKADGTGLLARLVGLSDRIQSLKFSNDGKTLVAAGGTPARFGEVQIWDVDTRKLKHSVTLTNETVFGASLSRDGSRVAVGWGTTRCGGGRSTGKEALKISNHENWVLGTIFRR